MIDGLSEGAVYDTKLLGDLSGVRKKFAYPESLIVIIVLFELILRGTNGEAFLPGGHSRNTLTIANVLR